MSRAESRATAAVRGIEVRVRSAGFTWLARVSHLGGGGTDYSRFNGRWVPVAQSGIPAAAYRAIRRDVRAAIAAALPASS